MHSTAVILYKSVLVGHSKSELEFNRKIKVKAEKIRLN